MSNSLDTMTLDELRALETTRYGLYVDRCDHAGKDDALLAEYDEVRLEIDRRLKGEQPRQPIDVGAPDDGNADAVKPWISTLAVDRTVG
jgi:hypothetical protein